MGKNAARSANRWETGIQESAPEAITDYVAGLDQAKLKYEAEATEAKMGAKYNAALAKARSGYSSSMTEAKAGEAYKQRMTQIAATGFTDYVKSKVQSGIELKQYLGSLIASIKAHLNADTSGEPIFKYTGLSDNEKDMYVNINLMKRSNNYTVNTDVSAIIADWKANKTELVGISIKG